LAHIIKSAARPKLAIAYVLVVGAPVATLLGVLRWGRNHFQLQPLQDFSQSGVGQNLATSLPYFALLMAQIALIILLSRAIGSLVQRLRQPRVIGEILAGILLGPSFLGWVAPGVSGFLFPAQSFGVLNALSQVGLVLFMFMVGLELNLKELHRQGHVAVLTSHASIAAPMALGGMLALYLYPRLSSTRVSFVGFSLFMGVAMSITAFPVLARILTERRLLRSRIGTMAIACAAVDDVTGWCVLAYTVAFIRAPHSALPLWVTVAALPVYLAIMLWGARPILFGFERAYLAEGELADNQKALLLIFLLASAFVTAALGLHLLFGAFVAGVVMPKERGLVSYIVEKFESLTVVLLLPLFFAYTGLRTTLGQVKGPGMWGICLLIIAVAVTGKLGGTSIAARLGGFNWRESLALGSLMNTRGLMELVVLNIGLDVGIISPQLFSMMVVMAIVTTMMAPPLLDLVYPRQGDNSMTNPGVRYVQSSANEQ
jgi:Kef-type K+ transport system membrane component KefB